jgi:hypothetical protein
MSARTGRARDTPITSSSVQALALKRGVDVIEEPGLEPVTNDDRLTIKPPPPGASPLDVKTVTDNNTLTITPGKPPGAPSPFQPLPLPVTQPGNPAPGGNPPVVVQPQQANVADFGMREVER